MSESDEYLGPHERRRIRRRWQKAMAVPLQVKVCRHQRSTIDGWLLLGVETSEFAYYEEQQRVEHGISVEFPAVNATPKQFTAWVIEAVRCLLWTEGTTCKKCGHVATGALTEHTPEEAQRWDRELYGRADELEYLGDQGAKEWERTRHEREDAEKAP